MRPSTILRTFSTKLSSSFTSSPSSSSSSIAPWPPVRTDFDLWFTSELDHLRIHPNLYTTATWLSKSLDIAVSTQEMATTAIRNDTNMVPGNYMDDTIELLDACQVVQKRIEEIRTYANSINIALHWLEGQNQFLTQFAVSRAQQVLEACTCTEKRCADFDTCGSSLRKLGERLVAVKDEKKNEVLMGSQAIALLVIMMANISLSFRSRRGISVAHYGTRSSNSWGSSISELQKEVKDEFEKRRKDGVVLEELTSVVILTQKLRSLLSLKCEDKREVVVELARELKKRIVELEDGIGAIEKRIDGLYRGLIDVRMCLLGKISNVL